jgi:MFS family permease
MSAGAIGLTQGDSAGVTIGSVLVMGVGAGLLLVTIQAVLADHHGERRAVALTEANVAASLGYLVLIGALAITAATNLGWRAALLASLALPLFVWLGNRRLPVEAPQALPGTVTRLPAVIWVAAGIMFCTTAAEWSVIAWGATFLEDNAAVSADGAVTLMAGYFGGVVAGRILGSRLTRAHDPARLFGVAILVAAVGFAVLWPSTTAAQSLVALLLLGVGLGNLYPLGTAVTIALAPGQAALASGRVVAMTSLAGILAPLVVGPLADATSLATALLVVPVLLAIGAVGLALIARRSRRKLSSVDG